MNAKKFDKKLSLNKTTISNLSHNQMHAVNGGENTIGDTYDFCTKFIPLCRSATFVCTNC
jgi:hypothetical protein